MQTRKISTKIHLTQRIKIFKAHNTRIMYPRFICNAFYNLTNVILQFDEFLLIRFSLFNMHIAHELHTETKQKNIIEAQNNEQRSKWKYIYIVIVYKKLTKKKRISEGLFCSMNNQSKLVFVHTLFAFCLLFFIYFYFVSYSF